MKKIVFYQMTQQAFDLISKALPCTVAVVDINYLNKTIEELFQLEAKVFSEGATFALYQGFEQNEIIDFVNKTKAIYPMIHASYTENNRLWQLDVLVKELTHEHQVFACYEKIVSALNKLNSLMPRIADDDKKIIMEAYMAYQGQMSDIETLELLIVKLNKILEDMKDEL